LNDQNALLQTIDERKGAACGVHGCRRHDRPGGGIPSVAEGMEARSDRCDVGAPGRSDDAAKDREAGASPEGRESKVFSVQILMCCITTPRCP
jgi:hypothetical protein